MSDSNRRKTGSHITPVVAALLSVSMSVLFGQLTNPNIVYGLESSLTLSAIIISYFLAFYSISRILHLKSISTYQLVMIFMSSVLMIFIGVSDTRGMFIKIWLWLLITILFLILSKAETRKIQYWYCIILLPALASSTLISLFHTPELLIEEDDVWLTNMECDKSGNIHATLCVRIKNQAYEANNVMTKIIHSNQVILNEDGYSLLHIGTLRKNKEITVRWEVVFKGTDAHSLFLYLVCSEKIFNKEIIIYPGSDHWKPEIKDVGLVNNFLIFIRNHPLLTF